MSKMSARRLSRAQTSRPCPLKNWIYALAFLWWTPSFDAKYSKTQSKTTMLIPDNIHPEQTVYFNGAFVLKAIQKKHAVNILDLYILTKAEREMSMPLFVLCLDWLFLLNLVTLNESGEVKLCS
jgi:hypothetical protein